MRRRQSVGDPTSPDLPIPHQHHIVLANGAGWGNFGDDAIVRSIAAALISGTAGTQPHLTVLGGPDSVDAVLGLPARSAGVSGSLGYRSRLAAAAAVARADLVVIGGGGLLQDELPYFYRPFTRAARIARLRRIPYAITAVGAYQPQTPEFARELTRLVNRAARVSVRDQASIDVLRGLGVERDIHLVPDPAFAFPFEQVIRDDARTIGVALRPWWHLPEIWDRPSPERMTRLITTVAEALEAVVETHPAEVKVLSMHVGTSDDDTAVGRRLIADLGARNIPARMVSPTSARDAASQLAACDAVLGMRLHSLILAASQGTPTVALNYDPKVANVMRFIERSEFVHPVDEPSAGGLADGIRRSLDAGVGEREAHAVARLRADAQLELTAVASLLPRLSTNA